MEKINILGVEVDRVDMKQATENCINAIENNKKLFIVTPNSEIIVNAGENKTLLILLFHHFEILFAVF